MKRFLICVFVLNSFVLFAQFTGSDTIPAKSGFTAGDIFLPLDNSGLLADVSINGTAGAFYLNKPLIFSAGFAISGKAADTVFANAVNSSSRLGDYMPGPVGSNPDANTNGVYMIKNDDPAFGQSWKMYRYAVATGAMYHDGDGNGIYDPVDLNSNGVWDSNEDRPVFTGGEFVFTVFNDSKPGATRRYLSMSPMGIEVQQYVFTHTIASAYYKNILFIRYRLINRGTRAEIFDSVYFSMLSDPDMGNYANDYIGSDSARRAGYVYEKTDNVWGAEPPALMMRYAGMPYSYIPGVSYTDVNMNNVYDEGIDLPLDSAAVHNGPLHGIKYIRGAKAIDNFSVTHYMSSHPTHGDPSTPMELRNYQLGGRDKTGVMLNPCDWAFGNGSTLANCGSLNPSYIYSGFPETEKGWLNSYGVDQRLVVSTGPFRMEKDKPVDITVAYLVGQGNSAAGSVAAMREVADFTQQIYNSNFVNFTTGIGEVPPASPETFSLLQNYPNPFNSATVIRYRLAERGLTTLRIYDVTGGLIREVVNEMQEPGEYSVPFEAGSGAASGVYFYELISGAQRAVQKAVYLK